MDPRQILEQEWPVITGAPVLAFVLVVLGAVAAWWLKSQNVKGEKAGFLAQLAARDERLLLASEQAAATRKLMEETNAKYAELFAQQQQGASPVQIALTTSALGVDLARVTTANSELYTTVTPSGAGLTAADMVRQAERDPKPPRAHKWRKAT